MSAVFGGEGGSGAILAALPLSGVRVLDLTRLLPGPFATRLLADAGADVVKVEDPQSGDLLRLVPPLLADGQGAMFSALNRGKRSLCLDLKSPEGPDRLHRLCAWADVLIEGFRPGVLERLGVGPAALCARHPRLIVCSLTGYGQTSPLRDRAGHDLNFVAVSGVLAQLLPAVGRIESLPRVQLGDLFGGGQAAVIAILAALYQRERTGRGQHLDVAMAQGTSALVLGAQAVHAASGSATPTRDDATGLSEEALSGRYPCYRVYRCADGRALAAAPLEPKFWQRFCLALERPEWLSRAFDAALVPEVEALLRGQTRDAWCARLGPADCCVTPVLGLDELPPLPPGAAPQLGADTEAIWAEIDAAQRAETSG